MRNIRWQVIALVVGIALISSVIINRLRAGQRQVVITSSGEGFRYVEAVAGRGEPRHINPVLAVSQPDRDLVALVFSGLTTLNAFGEPIPDMAEGWQVSEDGLTYTLTLRRDVRWHDGQPFSARDVDFTMQLLRDLNFAGPRQLQAFWSTVETFADDDHTVRFRLTQPLASFPEFLRIGILPAHILEQVSAASLTGSDFNLQPVGTGPFRLQTLTQEGRVVVAHLTANSDFYDLQRQPQLNEMLLRFYPDTRSALTDLQRGQVNALGGMEGDELETVFGSTNLNLYTTLTPIYGAVIFNQQEPERLPFFQNRDVRTALAMALDRNQIVAASLGGQAIVAESPILPNSWAFNPTTQVPPYNPEAAAATLEQEGWVRSAEGGPRAQESIPISFRLVVSDQPQFRELGQMAVEQWSVLDIDVQLEVVSAAQLRNDRLLPRNFDAAIIELGQGGFADPDPYPFWHQTQIQEGQNFSGFDDRDVSETLETARRVQNGVRRAELYREFQDLFNQRGAAIPLYYPVYNYAVDCRVAGVQPAQLTSPSDRFRDISSWQLLTDQQSTSVCRS